MNESDLFVGMQCHVKQWNNVVFVITEIRADLFPIGVARLGLKETEFYCRPIALRLLEIAGHTNN